MMCAKIFFVFFAQALLIKATYSQCLGREAYFSNYGLTTPGFGSTACATPAIDITPTSGGNFPVNSFSAILPYGISVVSENVYEGLLAAAGELPFVGTVAVEGAVPSAGAGAVNYGCGNGVTDIFAETVPAAAVFSPAGITAPIAAFAPAAGFAPAAAFAPGAATRSSCGCGCGFY